ncbi:MULTISPECIES: lasso peptide biosynthesis PqqD family chaperone [Streptomyces]|uniref:lasso peptide biosynthesis PqqD family chaperone n=1 Tax=Streptomyces TaxID=1883 RepID=UPI000996E05B|nr:lasso peptide biosynthesis PqqD family chaperone [Streptomyces iakyrus]
MLTISPHVVLTKDEDAAVLLDKKSGTYFRLNPMAVTVFEMLSAGQSTAAVVSALQARYPKAADRIPDDVQKLITTMRTTGVLV